MTVTLRDAKVTDAAEVARIYVDSWNNGFADHLPMRALSDRHSDRWARDLAGPASWRVAIEGDQLVGFVGTGPSRDPIDPTLGELDTIAVSPDRWRRGIGTALMADALESLRDAGFSSAVLWTLAEYPMGDALYRRCGWLPDNGRRDSGRQVSYRHPLVW